MQDKTKALIERINGLHADVKTLDLSHNDLGAEGARALAEHIGQLSQLTQLTLHGNGLGAGRAYRWAEPVNPPFS